MNTVHLDPDSFELIPERADPRDADAAPANDTGRPNPGYAPHHLKYLVDRAIDPTLAWREGVRSLDEADARKFTRCFNIEGGALGFAYGRIGYPYCRAQLDDREKNKGKTRAIPGVTPPPYIPDSVDEAGDAPLLIVEAPAKALAMASNGFPNTIGCGGVDAGIFEKGCNTLQAALLPFIRKSRPVVIAFDAGRAKNPAVATAEARVARGLMDFGCTVSLVEIPLGPDGEDVGPDDFLALHGTDAMRDLVAAAVPAEPARWAARFVAAGAAAARDALLHVPFVAAVAAGGPGALETTAKVLKAYHSKKQINDAAGELRRATRAKRDERRTAAATDADDDVLLERGDEVELAMLHLKRIGAPTVFSEGATYAYADGVWKPLQDSKQTARLMDLAGAPIRTADGTRPLLMRADTCRGALYLAQCKTREDAFFATAVRGLAFENGFLRWKGAELVLEPHAQEHRARFAYPFAFDPRAPSVAWADYLSTVWEGDPDAAEKAATLQEFVGAALFGAATQFKTALVLYGDADSGKSTCLDVVRGVFPPESVTSVGMHDFEQEYRRAKLAGKLLNTVAEVPSSELVKSEAFKAIIAGDTIEGRAIRSDPFDFRPVAGHLFAANTLPRVNDRSEGVWARWLLLSFNRRFERRGAGGAPTAKVDLARTVLESERPGLVAWAAEGFARLLANGRYTVPASSTEGLSAWKRESDTVALFFDDEIDVHVGDANRGVKIRDAYTRYRAWCERNGFKMPVASPTFGKAFAKIVRERTGIEHCTRVVRGYTWYLGVRYKRPDAGGEVPNDYDEEMERRCSPDLAIVPPTLEELDRAIARGPRRSN